MDMKKRIFLSMILLALCLIQASADDYYYKIKLYNDEWSGYIKVSYDDQKDVYNNGLSQLIAGKTVKDDSRNFTLLNKDNKVDLDKIYGIAFANEKGLAISDYQKIMLGVEFDAWKQIRQHIKYLELRDYKCDTYTNSGYFMDMFNVEKLELPKDGMTVGDGDDDCQYYFSNAHNLKEITIQSDGNTVDITETNKVLLNRVGKYMFSNCWNLSPKYTNRLLKDVEEIKRNAFFTNDDDRDKLAYNKMVIEIPNSVKEIGYQAFYNRVNVTGLNIQGDGELVIGSEAFKACDELAKISLTQDNKVLKIDNDAFMGCKQLNAFENMDKAKITYLGTGVFRECRSMTNDFVNGVLQNYADNGGNYANNGGKKIPAYLFSGCNGQDGQSSFTQLNIPASFTQIDEGAFAHNPDVTKIIVHSGTQIDAKTYDSKDGKDGIFYGMVPNKVQVEFQGDADNNYKVYRENIKVNGEDKGPNAFMFLLTKTLNENDDDYTVVAQRHADVRLTRTFKEGWNTLVLPFGARDVEGKCARIFQKALNASGDENFMIAAYRGLAKNGAQPDNSTFYFLQYTDYDKNPLDEFEPLLVRMTQKDINDANANGGVYTFKDVELNYDGDFPDGHGGKIFQEYTAEGAKERMGKKHTGEYFDGSYDQNANDKFMKCSYDDFYFTGTLYKQQGDAVEGSAFIAPGDYIIQNNTFVKCLASKKYGLKGFRGYFKQKSSSTSPAKGNIGISLVDRNGVVSSIHQVDGTSLTPASVAPAAVYNLSGQKVGNSLSTLAKGVYIVNGKKFVKK
mgnify:CR=1 FL=1